MSVPTSRRGRKFIRQVNSAWHRYVQAWLPRSYDASPVPVSVVIPLAEKDIEIAAACVASVRRHLRHPVERIVIPGQSSRRIARFCADEGLDYRDEAEVLDARVLDFKWRAGGQNRNGWIRQQFLKLTSPSYIESENFLILDADTILVRDLAFLQGSTQILWKADDLVEDYYAFTEALVGEVARPNYSLVPHCMLFQRRVLASLRAVVEQRSGRDWIETMLANIDTSTFAGMAEYELYAHFMLKYFPGESAIRYWYNRKADLGSPAMIEQSARRYARFNFLSDHNQKRADAVA